MGGQAVRLIHKEAEGYIGSDHRRAQLGLPVYVQNAEVMHKHGSSNTIWLIEKSTPGRAFDGSTCLWEGQYRLRHLATGRLLAVIMEPSEMEAFNQRAASGASPRGQRSAGSFLPPNPNPHPQPSPTPSPNPNANTNTNSNPNLIRGHLRPAREGGSQGRRQGALTLTLTLILTLTLTFANRHVWRVKRWSDEPPLP